MALYGRVERPECIACGLCQMLAPALFDYDQAGIAYYKPSGHDRLSIGLPTLPDPRYQT